MSQERTEAVVLRGVDFSETSRIVTFLSPARGRFACMAAGARRPKAQSGPVLDTFNRVELVCYWKDGREVQRLAEVSLISGYPGLKSSLEKSVVAAFALELVLKTAQANEPSAGLYHALVQGLEGMAQWTGNCLIHGAWQVLRVLDAAGFAPALAPEDSALVPGEPVRFSYERGVIGAGQMADCTLAWASYGTLCALAAAEESCPQAGSGEEVFSVLQGYVRRQLDCDFRSLRVMQQILGTVS